MKSNKVDISLYVKAMCRVGNSLYIVDERGVKPGIFRYDLGEDMAHFCGIIQRYDVNVPRMIFVGAYYYNDKVFFVPRFRENQRYIVIYDIKSGLIDYEDIECDDFFPSEGYVSIGINAGRIWLFPQNPTRNLVSICLDDFSISVHLYWKEYICRIRQQTGLEAKPGDLYFDKDIILIPITGTGHIAELIPSKGTINDYVIDTDIRLSFPIIKKSGSEFVLVKEKNEGIVLWNHMNGIVREYSLTQYTNESLGAYKGWFNSVFCNDRYIWLVPKVDQKLLRLDLSKGGVSEKDIIPPKEANNDVYEYYLTDINGEESFIVPICREWVIEINMQSEELQINYHRLVHDRDWTFMMDRSYTGKNGFDNRFNEDDLEFFIDYIVNKNFLDEH